ncbi:MAG: hypothetical protein ABL967_04305 [Bryobacteraceae bacterium]
MRKSFPAILMMFAFFVGLNAQENGAPKAAPAPKRDMNGVWMMRNPNPIRQYSNSTFSKEEPAMTEWAKEKFKQAKASNQGDYTLDTTNDPVLSKCYPPGTPRVYFHPYPFEFIQTANSMLMMFEYDHWTRRIWTDGRKSPEDPDPSWMGYAVGHWENDTTFVVETNGFNDRTWIDRRGHPHSTEMRVKETFRRIDFDHLQVDFDIRDPKALEKPWLSTFYFELRPKWELGEISCSGDYLEFSKFEK